MNTANTAKKASIVKGRKVARKYRLIPNRALEKYRSLLGLAETTDRSRNAIEAAKRGRPKNSLEKTPAPKSQL
jgi:hypothetical protein